MPLKATDIFAGVIPNYSGKGLLVGWQRVAGDEPVFETLDQFERSAERLGAPFILTPQAQQAIAAINDHRQP